jgi:hypothetical protein
MNCSVVDCSGAILRSERFADVVVEAASVALKATAAKSGKKRK